MEYATADDYVEWLRGRGKTIPLAEFSYWSFLASQMIDEATFNRLHDDSVFEEYAPEVIDTACALAELIFANDSVLAKRELSSYSIGGDYSESYVNRDNSTHSGRLQSAIRRGLGMTGLLYRGLY